MNITSRQETNEVSIEGVLFFFSSLFLLTWNLILVLILTCAFSVPAPHSYLASAADPASGKNKANVAPGVAAVAPVSTHVTTTTWRPHSQCRYPRHNMTAIVPEWIPEGEGGGGRTSFASPSPHHRM